MRLNAEIRYDADTIAVSAMLADRAFQERKCAATGALEHEVGVERFGDGAVTIRTRRAMPTDQVPDFVRTFVGTTLTVVQVDDWGPPAADGSREGTVVVEIENAPVRLAGSLALRPAGAGTVETIDGDVKARVPIVGGRIEKAVEPALRAAIAVEQREGTSWLVERHRP